MDSKSKVIGVRVSPAIAGRLDVEAKRRGISVSALLLEPWSDKAPKVSPVDHARAFVAKVQQAKRPAAKPSNRWGRDDVDPTIQHPAGPVLSSAVPPNLTGEARMVPKGGGRR